MADISLNTKEFAGIALFFTIFWILFLGLTGTLISGYNVNAEEHQIYSHLNLIQEKSFIELAPGKILEEITGARYRPLESIRYFLKLYAFGDNFFLWNIYACLLGIISSCALYSFGRMIRFSQIQSIALVFITFIGPQTIVWWWRVLAETEASTLVALGLLFIAMSLRCKKYEEIYSWLFVVLVILASLCKEAFVLIIPAMMFLYTYLYAEFRETNLLEAIKLTLPKNIVLALAFIVHTLLILFITGVEGNGYAGFAGFDPRVYISALTSPFTLFAFSLPVVIFMVVLLSYVIRKDLGGFRDYILSLKYPIIFAGLLLLPQIILHAKNGFGRWYFLPSMFAIGILTIYMIAYVKPAQKLLKAFIAVLICGFLLVNGSIAYGGATEFAKEGQEVNFVLETILHETEPNSLILVVTNTRSVGWQNSERIYLKHYGRENIRYYLKHYGREEGSGIPWNLQADKANFWSIEDGEPEKVLYWQNNPWLVFLTDFSANPESNEIEKFKFSTANSVLDSYQKLLEINPKSVEALAAIGHIYATHYNDLETAFQLFEQAIDKNKGFGIHTLLEKIRNDPRVLVDGWDTAAYGGSWMSDESSMFIRNKNGASQLSFSANSYLQPQTLLVYQGDTLLLDTTVTPERTTYSIPIDGTEEVYVHMITPDGCVQVRDSGQCLSMYVTDVRLT